MSSEIANIPSKEMRLRWLYMAIAIVASVLLSFKAPFSFNEDKGIIYVRSYSMTQKQFTVTQTELETGISHVTNTMQVRGLYLCYWAMLVGSVLCLLCFFNDEWRVWICIGTAVAAGLYYVMLIHYAIKISDDYYATLYPNYMAILPAVVLQMMLLTRRNVIHSLINESDEE